VRVKKNDDPPDQNKGAALNVMNYVILAASFKTFSHLQLGSFGFFHWDPFRASIESRNPPTRAVWWPVLESRLENRSENAIAKAEGIDGRFVLNGNRERALAWSAWWAGLQRHLQKPLFFFFFLFSLLLISLFLLRRKDRQIQKINQLILSDALLGERAARITHWNLFQSGSNYPRSAPSRLAYSN